MVSTGLRTPFGSHPGSRTRSGQSPRSIAASSGSNLVDRYGNPLSSGPNVGQLRAQLVQAKREIIRAKYDAAQTVVGNENHWANADYLDPHNAASLNVRRRLRSRSRYEVVENNPFLKGIVLTICNDFVGKRIKLQIADSRISKERQRVIEKRWKQWSKRVRLRQKLWRMRMAKIVDGESFARFYTDRKLRHPVSLNFQVLECDRISTGSVSAGGTARNNEIDGVRFNQFEQAVAYYILHQHPGGSALFNHFGNQRDRGTWHDARNIVHWFRQDRGWLRGIPELTPSLPLCAILRRYTLANLRHAETAADLTLLLKTEGPPNMSAWTDGEGNPVEDDPFDVFPIEMGMATTLPWGYDATQLNAVPVGAQYDAFVGSCLREITRPILVPFGIAIGTNKDSNMASAIVDQHVYRGGQEYERTDCEEVCLDHIFDAWFYEGSLIPGYFGDDMLHSDRSFLDEPLEHSWQWDRIGLEHTDPSKVATALEKLGPKGSHYLTDQDIQQTYFNRDVEEWRELVEEDLEFRNSLPSSPDSGPSPEEEEEDSEDDGSERGPSSRSHAGLPH